jgi:hypothetical protein
MATAPGTAVVGARPADVDRTRLALLVRIAASAGDFSPKLSMAVTEASDAEVRVMSDLVDQGLSIPGLVSLLQGAHVLVGDDGLYERWIFPQSRRRMSSHHRTVDKRLTPDYGLEGPLVRESLHGRAAVGTWVQLERTKATFQWGRLPTWSDVVHIRDYVIYRLTGKNVGPWGLSAHVDTRPVLLRPPNSTLGRSASRGLGQFARHRARHTVGRTESESLADLLTPELPPVGPAGDLFAPPAPAHGEDLLPDAPYKDELGEGIFGSLQIVRATAQLPPGVVAALDRPVPAAATEAPDGRSVAVPLPSERLHLTVRAALMRSTDRPVFFGIEEASP